MKYLLFAPFALLFCSFALEREKNPPEVQPAYEVKRIQLDPNLPKGTGHVIFTFNGSYGAVKGDSIRMSYNGTEIKVPTTAEGKSELQLKAGKYKFQFYYNSEHFEIKTDSVEVKAGWQTGITVWFPSSIMPVEAEKPVIYVYPDATQQVNISLGVNGSLGFTYPHYTQVKQDGEGREGWSFTADPDGSIHMNGKTFGYLFWDAQTDINVAKVDQNSGFVVKRDSLSSFFETQLTAMGLNAREREDFITYWAPQMQNTETCFVHFMLTEDYDQVATININPKPDHLFRVFMLWDDASEPDCSRVHAQHFTPFSRDGFTVVEWGGAHTEFLRTRQSVN